MSEFFAPAKINLWLHVDAPDNTGYHPIDSLFCAVELADQLTISASGPGIELQVTGADVGPNDRNLAYRAAVEFFAACNLAARCSIQLHKNIPAGGGLGGGSSDAATVLHALNELHGAVLPDADLLAMAARLGSDVPFFLCGASLAHATGRGQVLRALPALPRAPLLIAVPRFAVATRDAYAWLDEAAAFSALAASEVAPQPSWRDVAARAHNDFETVLLARFPTLQDLKQALTASGALISLVSGSGSALFGIYDSDATRDAAAALLNRQFPDVKVVATATRV